MITNSQLSLDESNGQSQSNHQFEDSDISDESLNPDKEVLLKLSLVNTEDNFTRLDWTLFEQLIDLVSKSWRFIAFSDRHSSAIFAEPYFVNVERFLEISSFNIVGVEVHVKVIRLDEASTSKGILYNQVTIPMSAEHLLNKLKPQGVIGLLKIQKLLAGSKEKFYTGSIILTVEGEEVPQFVQIGAIKLLVRPLAPRLMVCSHCSLIGHTAPNCKKREIHLCNKCFNGHDVGVDCPKIFCKNCNGNHSALRKDCPALLEERKIVNLKERHNLSYLDAKNIINAGIISNIPQYAAKDIIERAKHTFNRNIRLMEDLKDMTDKCVVLSLQKDDAIEANKILLEDNEQIPGLKEQLEKVNQELKSAYSAISSKDSVILEQSELIKELNDAATKFTSQLEKTSNQIKHFAHTNEDLKLQNSALKSKYKALNEKFNLLTKELENTSSMMDTSVEISNKSSKKPKITHISI